MKLRRSSGETSWHQMARAPVLGAVDVSTMANISPISFPSYIRLTAMLPIRNASRRSNPKSTYVCLNCRLNSTHNAAPSDLEDVVGLQSLSTSSQNVSLETRSTDEDASQGKATESESRHKTMDIKDRSRSVLHHEIKPFRLETRSDPMLHSSFRVFRYSRDFRDSSLRKILCTPVIFKHTARETLLFRKGELNATGAPAWRSVQYREKAAIESNSIGTLSSDSPGLAQTVQLYRSYSSKNKFQLKFPRTRKRESRSVSRKEKFPLKPLRIRKEVNSLRIRKDVNLLKIRKDVNPLQVRKQLGTPMVDKQHQNRREEFEGFLADHREQIEEREKSLEDNRLQSAVHDITQQGGARERASHYIVADEHPGAQKRWSSSGLGNADRRPEYDIPVFFANKQRARLFHTSGSIRQQANAAVAEEPNDLPTPSILPATELDIGKVWNEKSKIRAQLRQWETLHGNNEEDFQGLVEQDADPDTGDVANNFTRLPDVETSFPQDVVEEEERDALAHLRSSPRDLESGGADGKFLTAGDLVEIEYPKSERESVLAVFVRRLGYESQFFTMHGRWIHMPERNVPYSISGWISPERIEPLLAHLPDPRTTQQFAELMERSYVEDMSVPREIAADIVSKLVQFNKESEDIYRKQAGRLDNAHNILAHETDLRYGSLTSAASTLLNKPPDKLPLTALFTVRKALARAGFAFNFDRRSHRLTGYLQIRSKEQVKMLDEVRGWLRDWQDDLAARTTFENEVDGRSLKRHRTPKSAQHVYDFIEKARKIVLKSRETRDSTPYGNVGPSKKRFPITATSMAVRVTSEAFFTDQDTELVRFMEAWCCSNMFLGHPRIEALPPLILHAMGLYKDMQLGPPAGFMFLQELGAIMPYENRVRFDQHLLLPSSQHSLPLQNLMTSIIDMAASPNFSDSMNDLRHDWGQLPVYCIDDASAHEIDDGLSVEQAGSDQWWIHVHIANPSAFFGRDHALAKMARHMGESIYMPERAYMMLPRWATSKHFSLAKDRPCLTISAKLDAEGRTLERKITPGIVRNVLRLTPEDVGNLIGSEQKNKDDRIVLTVGGEPPPPLGSSNYAANSSTGNQAEELKTLLQLAERRSDVRRKAGGLFFEMGHPDIDVWQHHKYPGLAWDPPFRKGSRTVEGDPVIRLRTQKLSNWFQARTAGADVLVSEMMLLACETAAAWCAERQIPAIYRGLVEQPEGPTPEQFLREVLVPAARESEDGAYPMHLGIQYLRCFGGTVLQTTPVRHPILGMDYYGKVTSPLRRYGDMILHWQIEAALREEARTGKSLVNDERNPNRSFLPFSANVLDTVMLGLQPRERIIQAAKRYASEFWVTMLYFRAFYFDEAEFPFRTPNSQTNPDGTMKPLMKLFINTSQTTNYGIGALGVDLNTKVTMLHPANHGLEEPKMGDVWECEIDKIEMYRRMILCKPVRLVDRPEVGAVDTGRFQI